MSDLDSMSEEEADHIRQGQGEWETDISRLLDAIDLDNTDYGRVDPWMSLWRQARSKTPVGAIVNVADSKMLKQDMTNALTSVHRLDKPLRAKALEREFETFFSKLRAVYEKSGSDENLAEMDDQLRFARYYSAFNQEAFDRLERVVAELRNELRPLAQVEERAKVIVEEAKEVAAASRESANEALAAAKSAKEAAGQAGTNGLADEFQTFAADHKTASRDYRFWTITVLVAAVAIAVVFVLGLDRVLLAWIGAPGSLPAQESNPNTIAVAEGQRWQAVVYRLAILAGLAGLSAYLGRQAALHRRLHDWGRAVEAQARSFEAFAKQISDPETKKQVQLLFSNRVLGSPPEPTAEKTVTRDALQIVADAAMKSRGTA